MCRPNPCPSFLGREAELEQPSKRVCTDAYARILHLDDDRSVRLRAHAECEYAPSLAARVQRMPCVAEQIAENLDQLVPIEHQSGGPLVFALDDHIRRVREMNGDGVVQQLRDV